MATWTVATGVGLSSDDDLAVFVAAVFIVAVVVFVATGRGAVVEATTPRTFNDDGTEGEAVVLLSKILLMLARPGGDASQGSLSSEARRPRSAVSAATVASRAWIRP